MHVDPEVVKRAVLSNFNRSAEMTEEFEDRYGLFADLTDLLAKRCGVSEGMTVWDVGCGTGVSTESLSRTVGNNGHVLGIDFSPEMLDVAITRRGGRGKISFVIQDADHLELVSGPRPDAVVYTASIFLMPAPENTLTSAYEVLPEGGIVGMNYLIGTTDESGEIDICLTAKNEKLACAPYGRSIIDPDVLPEIIEGSGFSMVDIGIEEVPMSREEVRSFYSIPAQSAGLWPRTDYDDRLDLLDDLLGNFEGRSEGKYVQRWGWCAGVK